MAVKIKLLLVACGLAVGLYTGPVLAQANAKPAGAGILSDSSVQSAGLMVLARETKLFKSIGNGIALALARCSEDKSCDLSRNEVQRLLDTLNQRINILGARYASSGDKDLAPILLSYADERDRFVKLLAKAKKVLPPPKSTTSGGANDME